MKKLFQFVNANSLNIPLADKSVQMVATSPPYYGLRDYGVDDQLGLEPTMQEYIDNMVQVFREVWRVLKDDGVLWLNLGDSYSARYSGNNGYDDGRKNRNKRLGPGISLPQKNLLGIPWRMAFALQDDGWYLRQDIIWHKPNPMPESVRDRCTKSHEYIFLLSKSPKYYYDHEAIKEDMSSSSLARLNQDIEGQTGSTRAHGGNGKKTNGNMKAVGQLEKYHHKSGRGDSGAHQNGVGFGALGGKRNKRSVWTQTTQPYSGAHFAVWPPDLVRPMVLAGSRPGDIVLDPFCGSGTTGIVARQHGRSFVGLDLSFDYLVDCAKERAGLNDLYRFENGIVDNEPVNFGLFAEVLS